MHSLYQWSDVMKYYIKINGESNNIHFTNTCIIWPIPKYVDKQGVDKYFVTLLSCAFSHVRATGVGLELTPWVLT